MFQPESILFLGKSWEISVRVEVKERKGAFFLTLGRHLPRVVHVRVFRSSCGLINIILVSRHLLREGLSCVRARVYLDSSRVFSGVFKQSAIARA